MISKIVYVVLHYYTIEDTIECVKSIQENIANIGHKIVIVDNGSTNGTGQQLDTMYQDNADIEVILSNKNLGFANGNNIGIKYAINQFDADFIVVTNNDTVIKQIDFEEKIVEIYKDTKFGVLGPNVISLMDGLTQNPVPYVLKTKKRLIKRMIKFKLLQWSLFCNVDLLLTKNDKGNIPQIKKEDDYQLHGCCLILSREFLDIYGGLCDKTFMYCEEDILKQQCINGNIPMIYCDKVTIYHKEGSSTSASIVTSKQKRGFYYKNSYQSMKVLYKMMK